MELDRSISNKLLVGGIFAVLIFGLVGSQQAMAGDPNGGNGPPPIPDIEISKCLFDETGEESCFIVEGSARNIFLEEGDIGFFKIDAIGSGSGELSNIIVQDQLPAELQFDSIISNSGGDYDSASGEWEVGTISEGTTRSLIIKFQVLPGTCGLGLVNTAFLNPDTQDGTGDTNDVDSATVVVVEDLQEAIDLENLLFPSRSGSFPGDLVTLIPALEQQCPSSSTGGGDHESPTIGKNSAGIQIVPSKGICIDAQCWTVDEFDTGFPLLPLLSSSHTITNTIFCNEGVQECDYVGVSFMTSTDLFGELVMMVEAQKTDGEWAISWYDPQDFIHDPGDYLVGDPRGAITFTAQIVDGTGTISQDGNFLLTSFTIDFKNKDTDALVIRIQVGDEEHGQSTFWFNEGVEIIDSDAYPSIETEFENPLEIDSLCLNEDPTYRYSCGFAEIRDLATQNAEETLRQMYNNEYRYK